MGHVYISMLRGINVSGQNKIAMPDLKRLYEALGMENVQTYVQSGNVVFTCELYDKARLAMAIEAGIQEQLGHTVSVFIRELLEFERVAAGNPFLSNVQVDPAFRHVTFLYATTSVIILTDLPSPNADGDEYAAGEQAIYLYCPNGYGRTKLSNTYFERKLKVAATTRNWKTVNALLDMARKVDQG